MRSREDIKIKNVSLHIPINLEVITQQLILEVLLDIRELLIKYDFDKIVSEK